MLQLPAEIQDRISAIAADNTHGALELTTQAAEALQLLAEKSRTRSAERFSMQIAGAGKALVRAQPMMAPLVHLTNAVLHAVEGLAESEQIQRRLQHACEIFLKRQKENRQSVAAIAAGLVTEGAAILTHSSSSTVYHALELARRERKNFRVICTESRPMGEGLGLAQKLGALGIPTRLVVDSAASSIIREVQLVLVGGDAVSPQGLINKIGTYSLAVVAHSLNVPLYALCDTTKFLPTGYPLASEVERDPREVLRVPLQGVKALNYYFDSTPLALLTGLVTEERILRGPELEKLFTPAR